MKPILTLLSFFIGFMATLSAQSDIVPVGGEATGNGGSVSYSVGQIAVQTKSDGAASISEGVQQPYEISVVGVDNYPDITLHAVLYPNPTQGRLKLEISNLQFDGELKVYDVNGKYVFSKKLEGKTTEFDISSCAPGTYYINVYDGTQSLKSFKVVKMGR